MDILTMQLDNPFLLIFSAFIGGIIACLISRLVLKASQSMVMTVLILPSVVCAALIVINGSLGTGIAILGVFGLVRFRSLPGSGTDIVSIFYAMVIGLVMSTGYVFDGFGIVLLLALIIVAATLLFSRSPILYSLKILVPESIEDPKMFTDIARHFGKNVKLERIRSTNMGSMFELEYTLYITENEMKPLLDEIRVHNSNLNVSLSTIRPENTGL